MEIANNDMWRVRVAGAEDTRAIGRLLGIASMRHLHVDWHLPVDWLGTPGFILGEVERSPGGRELAGCLAVGADPPPAAWVRVAALKNGRQAERRLQEMLAAALPWLRDSGVSILGWLPEQSWPARWMKTLGFGQVNEIVTYRVELGEGPAANHGPGGMAVEMRPAQAADMASLVQIEEDAFEPLWRHSCDGLSAALKEAISFDVAEVNGRIAGFQYSVAGRDGASAHLVRLTVSPAAQGHGVGSSLMATAIRGYAAMGLKRVTLNTQRDNYASHRLYERFGFEAAGSQAAVWAMDID